MHAVVSALMKMQGFISAQGYICTEYTCRYVYIYIYIYIYMGWRPRTRPYHPMIYINMQGAWRPRTRPYHASRGIYTYATQHAHHQRRNGSTSNHAFGQNPAAADEISSRIPEFRPKSGRGRRDFKQNPQISAKIRPRPTAGFPRHARATPAPRLPFQ